MIRRLYPNYLSSFRPLAAATIMATAIMAALAVSAGPASSQSRIDIDFPLGIGLRVPQYDRVNGLTVPLGVNITVGDERVVAEPTIAYRSHLGAFDPSLMTRIRIDSHFAVTLRGERGTFSNERWIRSDIMNSLWSLLFGHDTRNYFRADRGEGQISFRHERDAFQSEVYVGSLWEHAWSTGWRPGEHKEPYSFGGKTDSVDGMRRANPLVQKGHIASALLGGSLTYKPGDEWLITSVKARIESALKSPLGGKFTQFTFTQEGSIRTVWGQQFDLDAHFVTTFGDPTPAQRLSYVGGSGTLATIDALALGGDRLFYVDARYRIPVPVVEVPFLGIPYLAPRFVAGAANIRKFGQTARELGVRAGAGFLWVQYMRNPRTDRDQFSGGFSLPR